jgi:hypothetical protein
LGTAVSAGQMMQTSLGRRFCVKVTCKVKQQGNKVARLLLFME